MAAIYLSEYARDNALTRIINLAIINLAGVSSVVFGLFGLSLFVVFLQLRRLDHLRRPDPGHHDPAGHHHHDPGSPAGRAPLLPRGQLLARRLALADGPARRPARTPCPAS